MNIKYKGKGIWGHRWRSEETETEYTVTLCGNEVCVIVLLPSSRNPDRIQFNFHKKHYYPDGYEFNSNAAIHYLSSFFEDNGLWSICNKIERSRKSF